MTDLNTFIYKYALIVCDEIHTYQFKSILQQHKCVFIKDISKAHYQLSINKYDALVMYTNFGLCLNEHLILKYIQDNFPNVYSIAILIEPDYKISHFLGANGVKMVLPYSELEALDTIISNIQNTKITLEILNISITSPPPLLQKILLFMEHNYLNIFTIAEIANYVGVTECTITREFQKNNLLPPKKILQLFKVKHSIELLSKTNLRIKEIATLSGFKNEHRYIECFNKIYNFSPGHYRKALLMQL